MPCLYPLRTLWTFETVYTADKLCRSSDFICTRTRRKDVPLYYILNTSRHYALQAKGYTGADELAEALTGCDLVVIPAGVPRKPGMTRDDLFNINASIVQKLAEACAEHCPQVLENGWARCFSTKIVLSNACQAASL